VRQIVGQNKKYYPSILTLAGVCCKNSKITDTTMTTDIIRSGKNNPCPVCDRTKDTDCRWFPGGKTVMCHSYVDGTGHDVSKWHYNGLNKNPIWGNFVLKEDPEFVKTARPKGHTEYYYLNRDGSPLVKVTRVDDGNGNKQFPQSHWDGSKWVTGNPNHIKSLIPIYRYKEVRDAIDRGELIFVVEGEGVADLLWELRIAATTTIGGSGGYASYGADYANDLEGAKLVLAPDKDLKGIGYIANFANDFPDQMEGYYLTGAAGTWRSLPKKEGMDIGDEIRDYGYKKDQIFDRIVAAEVFNQLTTPLLSPKSARQKPHFTTSWEDGLKYVTYKKDEKDDDEDEGDGDGEKKPSSRSVGNHIEAIAYCENPEGGGTGILIEFRNQRGKACRVLIPRSTLTGDAAESLRLLADLGYHYHRKQKQLLLDYLFGLGDEVDRLYTISDKTGWVNGSFLTPAKTYGDPDLRFRDPEPDNSLTDIKGHREGWKNEVAAKCGGNSRLIFALGTVFAAPLLEPAQIESGGFHLVGTTSIGKTTVLNVAASVAGLKSIPNWRSTSNALEGKAAEFNHGLLPLDEIGQAEPQTVGASAYMLGNGVGKQRMAKTLITIKPKTWLLLFLSTGEVAMVEYLRQAKISAKGGMEARMPSIPADAGKGYGVFENIHGYWTSGDFVAALETAIRKHQGTALDAYLTQLVETRKAEGFDKELRERVHSIANKLSQKYTDSAIGRVAVRFALVYVGLELAHRYNLLPFSVKYCWWSVKRMFEAWVNIRGGEGSIEIKEACNKIEHLLESNQYGDRVQVLRKDVQSHTYSVENGSSCRNMLAYKAADFLTDSIEYWVPLTIFNKEFADGVDRVELVKELQSRGCLKPSGDKTRATLRRSIGKKRQYFFVFHEFWIDSDDQKSDRKHNCEEDKKTLNQLNHPLENHMGTDVQCSSGWFNVKNPAEPTEPPCNKEENTETLQPGSVGSVQKTLFEPPLNQDESLSSKGSEAVGSVGSIGSVENHVTKSARAKICRFKVGDRVRYDGTKAQLQRQYAGVLVVCAIGALGDSYTCSKPDGRLTSWIEFSDLTLEVA